MACKRRGQDRGRGGGGAGFEDSLNLFPKQLFLEQYKSKFCNSRRDIDRLDKQSTFFVGGRSWPDEAGYLMVRGHVA